MAYDIFISYKRKSLAMANNLYYRLTMRGYSTFFDLEELGRDDFNRQLLTYIENASDVFVILEAGSLDACKHDDWEKDWFCREVAHAIKMGKNIIPVLLNGYKMPSADELPKELKELSLKHSPTFDFSYFNEYIDKLIEKKFITAQPSSSQQIKSAFKFYSSQNCEVYKDGKLVCQLVGESDKLFYLPIAKKGQYLFKCVNTETKEIQKIIEEIDNDEEKIVEVKWKRIKKSESLIINKYTKLIALSVAVVFVIIGVILLFNKVDSEYIAESHRETDEYIVSEDTTVTQVELLPATLFGNETFTVRGVSFDMVAVEGGTFQMGATSEQWDDAWDSEKPVHSVTLSDYWIGETEVTQELWQAVMGNNPSYHTGNLQRPVEYISWDDCQEFVRKLNQMTDGGRPAGTKFRLPTESEWEYVARGGKHKEGYKYSGSNNIDQVAWYDEDWDTGSTHPVAQKRSNALGIYDMSGNVWEWCQDWYDSNYYRNSPSQDPLNSASASFRVLRGGSWLGDAFGCRVSNRNLNHPGGRSYDSGMRLALSSIY